MKRFFYMTVMAVILIFTQAATAAENTDNNIKKMDEVVVTGTRFEQEEAKIPATVTVITAEDIKKSGAQTVPDILRNLGGVSVRDLNGNGNNQVVDLGGFGDSADRHVAVVVNGRRINPIDLSGVRWTLIPVDNIEKIEVLYGSGAVLYGDNAVGGVVNIITKDITEGTSADIQVMGGNQATKSVNGIFNYNNGPFGVQVGAEGYETNGYRDRSETRRKGAYGKIQAYPTDNILLSLDVSAGNSKYQLPGSLTEAQMDANREQAVYQADQGEDKDFSIGLGSEFDFDKKGVLTLRVNHRKEDIDSDMVSWMSYMMIESKTNALNTQYVLDSDLMDHGNRLTLGFDYYDTDYDAFRGAQKGATTDAFNNSKKTYSYYLQDEYSILKDVILNAGIRYEAPEIDLATKFPDASASYSFNDPETAWQLGLSYNFKPGSKVYASVYKAFRYPVVDEFTSLFTGAINTNLKQETSNGYELGARYTVASKMVINARIYTIDLDNEIAYDLYTGQNENLDKTRHRGAELDFRYQACTHAALYGSIGYTDSEFRQGENNGNEIPIVPKWKYNLGIDMKYGKINGKIQYNYVGARYFGNDYANTQKKMENYDTVDVYLGYEFKKAELFVNAKNILGKEYSDYGYYNSWGPDYYNYYPMPEATYWAGIKMSF